MKDTCLVQLLSHCSQTKLPEKLGTAKEAKCMYTFSPTLHPRLINVSDKQVILSLFRHYPIFCGREKLQIVSVAREGLDPGFMPEKKSFWAEFPKKEVKKIIIVANCVVPLKTPTTDPSNNTKSKSLHTTPANTTPDTQANATSDIPANTIPASSVPKGELKKKKSLTAGSNALIQNIIGKVTKETLIRPQKSSSRPGAGGAVPFHRDDGPELSTPAPPTDPRPDPESEPKPKMNVQSEPQVTDEPSASEDPNTWGYGTFFKKHEKEFAADTKFQLTDTG